jgi:excisionase family DNA binding protein
MISAPQQLDFGNLLFDKNRTVLYVDEVAQKLDCSKQHVLNLIESGDLGAINIGTSTANFFRIPIGEWEKFLRKRSSI